MKIFTVSREPIRNKGTSSAVTSIVEKAETAPRLFLVSFDVPLLPIKLVMTNIFDVSGRQNCKCPEHKSAEMLSYYAVKSQLFPTSHWGHLL